MAAHKDGARRCVKERRTGVVFLLEVSALFLWELSLFDHTLGYIFFLLLPPPSLFFPTTICSSFTGSSSPMPTDRGKKNKKTALILKVYGLFFSAFFCKIYILSIRILICFVFSSSLVSFFFFFLDDVYMTSLLKLCLTLKTRSDIVGRQRSFNGFG